MAFVDWACRADLVRVGLGSPSEIARFFESCFAQETEEHILAELKRLSADLQTDVGAIITWLDRIPTAGDPSAHRR